MCAEYTFHHSHAETVRKIFGLTECFDPSEKLSTFPLYQGYIVREDEARAKCLSKFQWGLIPPWAKEAKEGRKFFNARAETVHEKPTYRKAFQSRRCLVPVSGWYEWKQGSKPKQKYYITPKDEQPVFFAGIWQNRKDKDGKEHGSYSFLTVDPQGHLAEIHNRMPLFIQNSDHHELWFDTANDNRNKLYEHACNSIDGILATPFQTPPKKS